MAKKGTNSPAGKLEHLQRIVDALAELAPNATFGGKKLTDAQEVLNGMVAARSGVAQAEAMVDQKISVREAVDDAAMEVAALIVNGVVGDPAYGTNSALYEAMGYIPKGKRKSGLTRKKKTGDDGK